MTDTPTIELRVERQRRSGWRRPGKLYLMADGPAKPCGRLPLPLDLCPTCGGPIKPARGWTWVNGTALAASLAKTPCHRPDCSTCRLGGDIGRCGLLWIGVGFYPRPQDWLDEVGRMGISRAIPSIPGKGFELGKSWVMVAHRRALQNPDSSYSPGVFQLFRPRAIEYVVSDDQGSPAVRRGGYGGGDPDAPAKLGRLARRGVTLVHVGRIEDTPLFPWPAAVNAAGTLAGATDGDST